VIEIGVDAAPQAELVELRERTRQLEQALTSRTKIDTAVGVLLERHGLSRQGAFELLRRAARHHRRKIHDLAVDVIEARTDPPEIVTLLSRRPH
jgi:AmiR/NasT family two-component response regulator